MSRVVVVGASGFVGTRVCEALEARGAEVVRMRAPRLGPVGERGSEPTERNAGPAAQGDEHTVRDAGPTAQGAEHTARDAERIARAAMDTPEAQAILEAMKGADALVNTAGDPDASSRDTATLNAANGALPGLLGALAAQAGVTRFVHVSSAVVQGRLPELDASDAFDAFSPYAASKVLGERRARESGPAQTVCYRPPSVHHESRRVTRLTATIAGSALASVAAPGDQPTPQALAANVGDAVAELALCAAVPPAVVIHPWEGLSCSRLLELLGGRRPKRLPRWLARALVRAGELAGRMVPSVAANARRIEMVWFGQGQATSWLTEQGWAPPVGEEGWAQLRERLRAT